MTRLRCPSPQPRLRTPRGCCAVAWCLALALGVAGSGGALQAATWSGGGGDNNWTTAANWGGTAPVSGDDLIFAGANTTAVNNFAAATSFRSITFNAGAGNFTLSGNAIVLSGGASAITSATTSGTMTIALGLTFSTAAPTITTTAGGTLVISGAIANGGLLVSAELNGPLTLSGVVSGTGGLVKNGAATLIMSNAANSYSGGTTANLGILRAGATAGATNGPFGSVAASVITINSGAALDVAGANLLAYVAPIVVNGVGINATTGALFSSTADAISAFRRITLGSATSIGGPFRVDIGRNNTATVNQGNGHVLTKIGTATVAILNTSTGLGGVVVNAGTIQPENAQWAASAPVTLASGTTMTAWGSNLTFPAPITATSATVSVAGGTGNHTYSAATSLTGTITVNTAIGPITFNATGVLSGAGGLTKTGANSLTLAATNTYTGATVVSGGSLLVTGSTNVASTVAVSTGATLGGTGTVNGAITMGAGGILAPGTGGTTIGNLSTATVTMNATSIFSVDLNGTTPTHDRITSTGTVTCAGTLTVASIANAATGRAYPLITATTVTGEFAGLAHNSIFTQQGRFFQIAYTGTTVTLNDIAHTPTRVWDGGAGADTRWTTAANWDLDQMPAFGDDLQFAGVISLAPNNDFPSGSSFRSLTFNAGAGDFVIGGNAVTLSGGASALVSNATSGSMTLALPVTFSTAAPTITTTVGATLTLNQTIANGGLLLTTAANGPLTITGVINGAGGLTKTGAAAVTLAAVNTYAGTTAVTAGTMKMGIAGALPSATTLTLAAVTVLDLNGFNAGVGNISSSAVDAIITDNSAGNGTSTFTVSAFTTTISCLVLDGATRSVAVAIANANTGNMLFAGTSANTFSGGLTLLHTTSGSRLRVNSAITTQGTAGAITSGPFGRGTITIGQSASDKAGILFDAIANQSILNDIVCNTALGTNFPGIRCDIGGIVLAGTITANLAPLVFTNNNGVGSITVAGRVTGPNGMTLSNGAGTSLTVILTNSLNDYAGATTISGTKGFLIVGSGTSGRLGSADVVNNGTLRFQRTDAVVVANVVSGTGTVSVDGALNSVVTLSGANTWSGATTITAGTLRNGAANVLGNTTAVTVSAGAFYDLANVNETVGSISGAGAITLGSGNLTAGGNNTTTDFSGVISGSGMLSKTGTGTLTLSGTNLHSGGTTLLNGYLTPTLAGSLGSGTFTFTAGTNASGLRLTTAITIANAIVFNSGGLSGRGAFDQVGPTSGALSGPITINGATNVGGHFGSNTGGVLTVSGMITSSVAVTVRIGTVVLSGGGSGYTAIDQSEGTLLVGANDGIATTAVVDVASFGTGTLDLNGFNQTLAGLQRTSTQSATVTSATPATLTLNQPAARIYGGVITGMVSMVKNLAGVLTLSGASTYSGTTTVAAGGLLISNATALGATSGATTVAAGANLTVAGVLVGAEPLTISGSGIANTGVVVTTGTAAWSGPVTLAANATIGSTGTFTVSGVVGESASGMALTKLGSGTLALGGANTYTGATTLSAGTLLVNGDTSAATGAVAVANGTTLGGTGTIGGAVTVANGGILSPGSASTATLTISAPGTVLNLSAGGGSHPFALGTSSDRVACTGASSNVNLGGALVVTDAGGLVEGTYSLITFTGTGSGTFSSVTVPTGFSAAVTIDNTTTRTVILTLTAANTGLSVASGEAVVMMTANLFNAQAGSTTAQVVYTVTTAPVSGFLRKNLVALAPGGTFTQADIDNRLISYEHADLASSSDSVVLEVVGNGGPIATRTVVVTVAGSGLAGGLVAYLPFEQSSGASVPDRTGAYTGTITGTAAWGPGQIGNALTFNGTSTYVQLPAGMADFTGGLTFSVWARPTASGSYARLLDFGNGGPSNNVMYERVGTTSDLRAELYTNTAPSGVTDTGVLTNNSWHHYLVTVTGTGVCYRYKNGAQLNSVANLTAIPNVTRTLNYIGKSNWGNDALFAGQMDDIRIYNRPLSAGEAKLLSMQAAPALTNVSGASLLYPGDGSVVALDVGGDATLSDADDLSLSGGSLLVHNSAAVSTSLLGIATSGGITLSGATVSAGGNAIGVIDTTLNGVGTHLQVAFTTIHATPAAVQALVRALTYSDTSGGQRTFTITLGDGVITPLPATVTMTSSTVISVTTNTGLTVVAGTSGAVTSALLAITDTAVPAQTPADITFTVVRVPAHGLLRKNLALLGAGGTFTEADLGTGIITYEHGDLAQANDDVVLSVRDSLGNDAGVFAVTFTASGSGLSSGLVGHWRLDEGAPSLATRDATGGGFTGTLAGGMTGNEWGAGQLGNALVFDNVLSKRVDVPAGIALANSSFTIAGWARRDGSGTTDHLFGQGTGLASLGLHFGYINTNKIRFGFFSNDLDTTPTYTDTGTWHHLVGTFNATSRMRRIWRDGTSVASGAASANYQGSGAFQLGAGGPSGNGEFHGALDDLRVYNRDLSGAEIAALAVTSGSAPVIAGLHGTVLTVVEEGSPVMLDPSAATIVSDSDDLTFAGGSLLIDNVTPASGTILAIANAGGMTVSGSTVSYAGNAIGTIATGVDGLAGRNLRIDFTTVAATPAAVSALIHAVTVADTASGSYTIRVGLSDGVNGSNLALIAVTVTPIDDPIILVLNTGVTAPIDGVAIIDNTILRTRDEDLSAGQTVYTLVSTPAHGHLRNDRIALGVGSTFTQADIDNHLLSYEHGTAAQVSDGFTFSVSDTIGGGIPATTAVITISGSGLFQGLGARWGLDEGSGITTADSSGNGNTGTITNATWSIGRLGNGLTFPGTANTVRVVNSASVTPGSAITVSGWFRTAQTTASSVLRHDGHFTALQPMGTNAQVAYWVGGTLRNYAFPWNGVWNTNTWVHYAASYDQTAGLAVSFNGVLTHTSTTFLGALTTSTTNDFMLGATEGVPPNERYDGQLDEVRVYNRALTPNEVRLLAQQAVPAIANLDGDAPVFSEDAGAVAIDSGAAGVVSDADDASFGGGYLLVHPTTVTAADTLSVANAGVGAGQIGVGGTTITFGGSVIGIISATDTGVAGADLRIALTTSQATPVAVAALVRALRFSTAGETPDLTSRVLQVTLNDNTFSSAIATVTMGVRAAPDVLTRITVDADGDGLIDRIRLGFDQTLNDAFSGLTVTVSGYAVSGYATGSAANDASLDVLLTETGSGDTGATPVVQVASNTTLGGAVGGALSLAGGVATAASDAALPVLVTVAWSDGGLVGAGLDDRVVMIFSEPITAVGLTLADLGLPVTGDTFASSVIPDQSGQTVSMDVTAGSSFTPAGTYAAAAITAGSPSGVYLVTTTGITDAVGLQPLAGTAAGARDLSIGTPIHALVDLNGPAAGSGYTTFFYNESPAAAAVDAAALTVTDSDQATVVGATIVLTNPQDVGAESVDVTVAGAISKTWDAGTTTLTLTGSDTVARYQAVLRTLTYLNVAATMTLGDRLITVAVDDGHGLGPSATATVTVGYNTPPVATSTTLLTVEGVAVAGMLGASDVENDTLTWEIVMSPSSGTLVLTASTGAVVYTPVLGVSGEVTFTFRVFDGRLWSSPATATVRLTARLAETRPQVVSSPPRLGWLGDPLLYQVVVDVSTLPPGADLGFTVVAAPAGSTVILTKTGATTATLSWTATGTPDAHQQLEILVSDPLSGTSDHQTIQVLWRTPPGGAG